MIEAAAQLTAYFTKAIVTDDRFFGFVGVDDVKFRETVVPPARLILIGRAVSIKPRRTIFRMQGLLEGKLVFEAKITGMPV